MYRFPTAAVTNDREWGAKMTGITSIIVLEFGNLKSRCWLGCSLMEAPRENPFYAPFFWLLVAPEILGILWLVDV